MHCGQHAGGCCGVAGAEKLSFRLRLPLTRQLLRFGDLFWGSCAPRLCLYFFGIVVFLRRRQVESHVRLDVVHRGLDRTRANGF